MVICISYYRKIIYNRTDSADIPEVCVTSMFVQMLNVISKLRERIKTTTVQSKIKIKIPVDKR